MPHCLAAVVFTLMNTVHIWTCKVDHQQWMAEANIYSPLPGSARCQYESGKSPDDVALGPPCSTALEHHE